MLFFCCLQLKKNYFKLEKNETIEFIEFSYPDLNLFDCLTPKMIWCQSFVYFENIKHPTFNTDFLFKFEIICMILGSIFDKFFLPFRISSVRSTCVYCQLCPLLLLNPIYKNSSTSKKTRRQVITEKTSLASLTKSNDTYFLLLMIIKMVKI